MICSLKTCASTRMQVDGQACLLLHTSAVAPLDGSVSSGSTTSSAGAASVSTRAVADMTVSSDKQGAVLRCSKRMRVHGGNMTHMGGEVNPQQWSLQHPLSKYHVRIWWTHCAVYASVQLIWCIQMGKIRTARSFLAPSHPICSVLPSFHLLAHKYSPKNWDTESQFPITLRRI